MTAATAEWLNTDFYAVLGVPPTASTKEITRAYRKLARELHPDTRTGGGNDDRFKDVTAAYEVLGDEAKRREYDSVRAAAKARAGRGGGVHVTVHQPGAGAPFVDLGAEDVFGGIRMEDLFGSGFGGGHSTRRRRPRRGADLHAVLRLGFEQAVRGATVDLPVSGSRTVTARIPPGVQDGQTVRLPARGDAGIDGGPPGDLLVQVDVDPHPLLGRDGRHLTLTAPVTFPEAALGADIAVPTLDGPVTLRIPPGTASGTTLRVRGRGVPGSGGAPAGDLLVTVQVDVPRELNDAQRTAVEQLAAATTTDPRAALGV